MADFNEVAELFHIFKASHEHGEQFKHIREAALAKLKAINEEHAPKKDEPEESVVDSTPKDPSVEDQMAEQAQAEEEPIAEPVSNGQPQRRV